MSFYFNTNNSINPIDTLVQMFKQSESSKLVKPVEMQKKFDSNEKCNAFGFKNEIKLAFFNC